MAVFFTVAAAFHSAIVIVCFTNLSSRRRDRRKSVLYKVYSWCRGWFPSHALGLTLLSLPALCALANFQCERLRRGGAPVAESREFYLQLCFFGVVHFTNLTALNNCVKSAFASVMAIAILILVSPLHCSNCLEEPRQQAAMAVRVNVSLEDQLQQHLL